MTPELAEEFRQIGMRGFERGWVGCAEALVDPEVLRIAKQAVGEGATTADLLRAMSEVLIELGRSR